MEGLKWFRDKQKALAELPEEEIHDYESALCVAYTPWLKYGAHCVHVPRWPCKSWFREQGEHDGAESPSLLWSAVTIRLAASDVH